MLNDAPVFQVRRSWREPTTSTTRPSDSRLRAQCFDSWSTTSRPTPTAATNGARATCGRRARRGRAGAGASSSALIGPGSATAQPPDLVLDLLAGPGDGFEPLGRDGLAGDLADAVGAEVEL